MKIKQKLLDLVFPKKCVYCQKVGVWICQKCRKSIVRIKHGFCPACKKITFSGRFCTRCRRKTFLAGVMAFGYYKNVLKEIIHYYKYRNIKELRNTLCSFLIEAIQKGLPRGKLLIVPIPLHSTKLKERGFNQASEIAKVLSKNTGIEFFDCLIRKKETKSQFGLNKYERLRNMKNAFKIKKGFDISGKTVLIIDDVYTSGATMNEAAKILKANKAKSVWGLCIAMA